MPKPTSGQPTHSQTATGEDLHQILGDMDDSTAVAILALHPTVAQLEEARVWLSGAGDILGKEHRPLDGVVAQIFDMLTVEEEEQPPSRRWRCAGAQAGLRAITRQRDGKPDLADVLILDGSHGEGGGQILRTALSLSAMTARPFRLHNIRAGRRNPGLLPQHLSAVRAAAAISGATISGDRLGSTELSFAPSHSPSAGSYVFDVAQAAERGSAGSATLVLQTIVLPLALAEAASTVVVRGGTHVEWSPPFDDFAYAYFPALRMIGFCVDAELKRWGWYPVGGGEIVCTIAGRLHRDDQGAAWPYPCTRWSAARCGGSPAGRSPQTCPLTFRNAWRIGRGHPWGSGRSSRYPGRSGSPRPVPAPASFCRRVRDPAASFSAYGRLGKAVRGSCR